jgi:hypothetical protein
MSLRVQRVRRPRTSPRSDRPDTSSPAPVPGYERCFTGEAEERRPLIELISVAGPGRALGLTVAARYFGLAVPYTA